MKFKDDLKSVLIADDEPYNLQWLLDFLEAKDLTWKTASNVDDAVNELTTNRFKFVIVDLSIPCSEALRQSFSGQEDIVQRYPGLFCATKAKTTGHNPYQVVVYSVHDDPSVREYCEKIRCNYVLKGKPYQLREIIEKFFSRTPHQWHSGYGGPHDS